LNLRLPPAVGVRACARAKAALERAKEHVGAPIQIDPALIERFGRTTRENFNTGSEPFRKALPAVGY
jgi:hypothetical protein